MDRVPQATGGRCSRDRVMPESWGTSYTSGEVTKASRQLWTRAAPPGGLHLAQWEPRKEQESQIDGEVTKNKWNFKLEELTNFETVGLFST